MSEINLFGETNFRNKRTQFGIQSIDRRKHVYVIGKTGMGKTTLLENLAIQDIQAGRGVAIVDPHGEFAEKMLDFVPSHRVNDVIYFNPADLKYPIAFNVLEKVAPEYRHLIASGLMGIFKKIWPDVWSGRMEYILYNSISALLEYPDSTLLGINRILADKDYRQKVVEKVTDVSIKSFWENEFAKYPDRFREEAVAPIQNKVGQFISVPLIRNIIGQNESSINIREVIDTGKILILNLSKGRIGEDASRLLGALIVTKLQLAAMSRVDIPEDERKDFYLYVDEFQNFATESFAGILSEARKYRLDLTLAHQYITQMDEKVRDAVFGNVGTTITFRVGAADAEFLEKEFAPEFSVNDLVNLGFAKIYLKLMIDGVASRPFSADTLAPWPKTVESHREKIIRASQERYGHKIQEVEEKIVQWSAVIKKEREARQEIKPQFESVCWSCGQKIKVSFQPDGVRPVYCKDCLIKKQSDKQKTASAPPRPMETTKQESISLEEATKREPTGFRKRRKEVDIKGLRDVLKETMDAND